MKVLMFTDYFYPHVGGGVEKAVYEISKVLVKSGLDINVLTLNTQKTSKFEKLDDISIYRANAIGVSEVIGAQSTISTDALFLALRVCREVNPDILHAHNIFFSTTMVAALVKRVVRKPLVVTMHLGSMNLLGGIIGFLTSAYERTAARWILNSSNHIIAVSRAVLEQGLSLGIPRHKVSVIPNGVNLQDFSPSRRKVNRSEAKKIVFVGRLLFNKGVQYLVKAAPAILSRHPVEFVIVGDGPMKYDIVRMTETQGVRHAFKFLCAVPSVSEVLRESDIFVRPSLTEGMPLTVLEAMACGLPVVATRVAGTPEIVTHGVTGLLCPPRDVERLAEAILKLVENPEMASHLGSNARRFVEQYHGWHGVAEMTHHVYDILRESP